jgi:hypothetical protein
MQLRALRVSATSIGFPPAVPRDHLPDAVADRKTDNQENNIVKHVRNYSGLCDSWMAVTGLGLRSKAD